MSAPFEVEDMVGWFDLDANRHMKNTAYMEKAVACRLRFFLAHGFSPEEFARHDIAFVVVRDETSYAQELFLGQRMHVQLLCGGVNASGSRFLVVNRILAEDGTLVYEIRSMLVWLDTKARKSCAPPAELAALIGALARTDDYRAL